MGIPQITEEQREQFGNRTFDRGLYVYTAKITKQVVRSEFNEVHRTGETVREFVKWSVIAPSQEWADFAFDDRFRGEFTNVDPTDVTCEMIPVCAEINGLRHK